MPVHHQLIQPFSLVWVRATEPFHLDELYRLAEKNMRQNNEPHDISMPLLLDLRGVNLVHVETKDIQQLIRKRLSLGEHLANNPCAFVAGDETSFGVLRMYASYAEIHQLREDGRAIVTADIGEAVRWLSKWLDSSEDDLLTLQKIVE